MREYQKSMGEKYCEQQRRKEMGKLLDWVGVQRELPLKETRHTNEHPWR